MKFILKYLITALILLVIIPGRSQPVYPLFNSQFSFPVNRVLNLGETGLILLASDHEIQIWDKKSQAYYGGMNLLYPENIWARIRLIEYLENKNQLAVIAEQVMVEPNRTPTFKDFLYVLDVSTQALVLPLARNGIEALIKYKYDENDMLPVIQDGASIFQYSYVPATGNIYTVDRAGNLAIYKRGRLEKTVQTGFINSRILQVDDTESSAFLTDDSTGAFIELNLPNATIKHKTPLLSYRPCRNYEPPYKDHKNFMVKALSDKTFMLLDSMNRTIIYGKDQGLISYLNIPDGMMVTSMDWNQTDSTLLFISASPTCKIVAGSISSKTMQYTLFNTGSTQAGYIGYVTYNPLRSTIRMVVPGRGEHETDLGTLKEEVTIPSTNIIKDNYAWMGTWEHGFVNVNDEGTDRISIDVFRADSIKTEMLYSQQIKLNNEEVLVGIRPDSKWWLTLTNGGKYTTGNLNLYVYDSTGKRIFNQTGHFPIQLLNGYYVPQQVFSEDNRHMMIKELLGRTGNRHYYRLRVYSTDGFALEADIRYIELSTDPLGERTAFFDHDSKSLYYVALQTNWVNPQTVLFKYRLQNKKFIYDSELPLCGDMACQLPLSINTIVFNRDNSLLTYTGYVNISPQPQEPEYLHIARCINVKEQSLKWHMNFPLTGPIRRVFHFRDYTGFQSDRGMEFVKLKNNDSVPFLTIMPIINTEFGEYSNLFVSTEPSSPVPIYYERTGNESLISFRVGDRSFGRSFFDISFNRPDEILKRIPGSNPEYIERFYRAVQKRSERITNRAANFNAKNIPDIKVNNTGYVRDNFKISLSITSRTTIKYLRVVINGNVQQVSLPKEITQGKDSFNYDLYEQLGQGENRLEISAIDSLNRESIPVSVVQYEFNSMKNPDLHVLLLSVGIYKYHDSVNWVVSDGKVLEQVFLRSFSDTFFNKIHVKFLSNHQVAADSVDKWLAKLRSASPRDYVIVFYNGHGIIDRDKKLLLFTTETARKHPFTNAINYQQVLDKMDSLPARQKLFLIDACYSGDFDKDGLDLTRGRKGSFNFMQEMFTFSNKGNGTFVYTSCAGNRSAVGPQGDTGASPFVTAIKEALEDLRMPQNYFGMYIRDLFKYVTARTQELSQVNQIPNLKINNPGVNWRIK